MVIRITGFCLRGAWGAWNGAISAEASAPRTAQEQSSLNNPAWRIEGSCPFGRVFVCIGARSLCSVHWPAPPRAPAIRCIARGTSECSIPGEALPGDQVVHHHIQFVVPRLKTVQAQTAGYHDPRSEAIAHGSPGLV